MSEAISNPYIGPRAFQRQETVYGRGREARQLFDLLTAERIILLHAPSGAGKTSLIQAALIPLLEADHFFVPPVMRVNRLPLDTNLPPETNRYILSLLLCLDGCLPYDDQLEEAQLATLTLDGYLQARQEQITSGRNPVFIFDQFEECLTLDPYDLDAKQAFFAQLGTALRNRSRWALFSMRDDFVAGLEPYLRPLPTRLSNRLRLDLLDHASAAEAIRKPAENMGITFDPDAAAALIQDLSTVQAQKLDGQLETRVGPYVEPVQLQVVCRRLWSRLAEAGRLHDGISLTDVAEMGAVSQALGGYYQDAVVAIAQQTGVNERHIRDWVGSQLITEQGIRGQVLRTPDQSQGLKNKAIDQLVDAHLVRKEERRGALWYELAHDRLIEPIQNDNRLWREAHLSLLQTQAELWQRNGRNVGLLLTDKTLTEVEAWAKEHPDEMTALDHDFLLACRRRQNELLVEQQVQEQRLKAAQKEAEMERRHKEQERERAEIERQLQAEQLKATQERAEAERLRQEQKQAETERRAQIRLTRVFRQAAAALSFLLLVALIFAAIAVNRANVASVAQATSQANEQRAQAAATIANDERLRAEANSALAATRSVEALENANIAMTAQVEAEADRARADAAATIALNEQAIAQAERDNALALNLALQGSTVLNNNPELGILLALEASYITPAAPVVEILQKAIQSIPPSEEVPGTEDADLLLSQDGQWLFARPAGDPAFIWAMPEQKVVPGFQSPEVPTAWAFSPESHYLAVAFFGDPRHGIQVWQLEPDRPARLVYQLETDEVIAQLLWRNETELISGHNNGQVLAWTLDTPAATGTPTPYDQTDARLLFQLTGSEPVNLLQQDDPGEWVVATGISRQEIVVWNESANAVRTYSLPDNEIITVVTLATRFASQSLLFLGGSRGQARLIFLEDEATVDLPGHTAAIAAAVFNYDRYYFVTASQEGLIQWWQTLSATETPRPIAAFTCDTTGPIQLAFFPGKDALALACADGFIEVHPGPNDPSTTSFKTSSTTDTQQLFVMPDGEALLIRPDAANARLWFLESDIVLEGHSDYVDGLAFQPGREDSYRLVSTGLDGTLRVWEFAAAITSGEYTSRTISLTNAQTPLRSNLAWHPNGDLFAYFGQDGRVHLWSVTGDDIAELTTITGVISTTIDVYNQIYTLAFSPDGSLLATRGDKGQVNLWQVSDIRAATGTIEPLTTLDDQIADTVFDLSFTADNSRLAVLTGDQVTLWNISVPEQATILAHIPDFGGTFSAALLHPEGRFLFTGDFLGQIQVWDLQGVADGGQAELRQSLTDHKDLVWLLALAGDHTILATSSRDGSVILWQLNLEPDLTQAVLTKIRPLYDDATGYGFTITFSPDQQWLALADDLGIIHLLAAIVSDTGNLASLGCNRVGRNLRYDEWLLYFGPVMADGELLYRRTCPEYPVHETVLTTLQANGESLAEQGQLTEAVTLLELVVSLDEAELLPPAVRDDPIAYVEQIYVTRLTEEGKTLALAGDVDRALERFNEAIALNPTFVAPELLADPQVYAWQQALIGLQNGYVTLNQEADIDALLNLLEDIQQNRPDLLPEAMRLDPERYLLARAIGSLIYAGDEDALVLAQQLAQQTEDSYLAYRVCAAGTASGLAEVVTAACERIMALAQPPGDEAFSEGSVNPGGGEAWLLTVTQAQTITIQLRPRLDDSSSSSFYPTPTLLGPANDALYAEQSENWGRHGIRFRYVLPEPGNYILLVSGYDVFSGNEYGGYELAVWDEAESQALSEVDRLLFEGETLAQTGDITGSVTLLAEAAGLLPGAVAPLLRTDPTQYAQEMRASTLVNEGIALAQNGDVTGAVVLWAEAGSLSTEMVAAAIPANPQAYAISLAFPVWVTQLQVVVAEEGGEAAALELLASMLAQLAQTDNGYLYFQLCQLRDSFVFYPAVMAQLQSVCESLVDVARPLTPGETVTGFVVPYSGDLWYFTGETGQTVTIEMQATLVITQTGRLDSYLYLIDPDGGVIAYNDDFSGEPLLALSTDSRLIVILPIDGVYLLAAAGYSTSTGAYQLRLDITDPSP